MRIAVLSDIHGNAVALDGVLADARSQGADEFWVIGDLCAIGPQPAAALDRVASLTHVVCTRGNTDRYVVTGEGPPPTLRKVEKDPSLIPVFAEIASSMAWTRGYLTASGGLEWLERLPLDTRLVTRGGFRALAVHASPGTDDGEGVHPGRSDDELRELLRGADADLVLVGHTHEPMLRRIDRMAIVNLGSVSNPRSVDLRASYVLLELGDAGVALKHRRVRYDHAAFEDAVRRSRHPAAEFIMSYQRGEHKGHTPHPDHTAHATDVWVDLFPKNR